MIGGVLIIGLLYGADAPDDGIKYAAYAKSSQYVKRFKEANGATRCKDFINIDLTLDNGFETYNALNLQENVCSGLVYNAVRVFMDLLAEWEE